MKPILNVAFVILAIFSVAIYIHFDSINHVYASIVALFMLVISIVIIIKNNIKE